MLRQMQRLAPLLLLPSLALAQNGNRYTQSNLISDGFIKAQQTDPKMINPWGVAIGAQTPFWINAAGSGLSEVYDGGGNEQFVVTIPGGSKSTGSGSPSGIAFNSSTTDFALKQGGSALFIFASLDGVISGWNASITDAQVVVDNSANGAVYTGVAIDNNGAGNFILAANFAANEIDVFDNEFARISLSGKFIDPALPTGYAPFNVHVLNDLVYVMYAMQTPGGGPATPGAGAGFVSVFDTNGNFLHCAISGGNLNAPWGIALAPAGFGAFGGDLLVGNFGDGTINAFDPVTFALKGQLQDATGKPIVNDHLWEILFGGKGTGDPNTLYFSAGVNDEKNGLFGAITATAPAATGDFTIDVSAPALTLTNGASGTLQVTVAPTNGFSSPVILSVSGLPSGLTFQVSPSAVIPTSGKAVTSTLTISGSGSPTPPVNPYSARLHGSFIAQGIIASGLLPLRLAGLLPIWSRRRRVAKFVSMLGGSLSLLAVMIVLQGCGGSSRSATPVPPVAPGTSTVTVTASAGSIQHATTFVLTVE